MIDKDDPFWEYNEYCKEQEELKKKLGCDYDRFNSPPPPIYIGPVKVKTLKERLEEERMKAATSVQNIKNVRNISFSITNDPTEIESKLTVVASTDDDIFKFEFEGSDILQICKAAGLFTGWEKEQKIRELESKNEELKEENKNLSKANDSLYESVYKALAEKRQMKEEYEKKYQQLKAGSYCAIIHGKNYNTAQMVSRILELEKLKTPTIENFADEKPVDNVNHPSHYTGKYECIDVMQDVFGYEATDNFCLCNAFKYIWRARKKNGTEDVKKAVWYLNKYLELTEKEG